MPQQRLRCRCRFLLPVLSSAIALAVLLCGCSKVDKSHERVLEAQTIARIASITIGARMAVDAAPPPLEDTKAFAAWVMQNSENPPTNAEIRNGMFLDAWGEPIRVIASATHLQVASCGPNGKWDNGANDDIVGSVVLLERIPPYVPWNGR